ncbi:MAG: LytTR family DNA-binding domain-containing protein [Myxococcota bacterium]
MTMRVLVVDDEPLAGRRLARQLERFGHRVVAIFESGLAAVEYAQANLGGEGDAWPSFDIVFLDIQMPGLDGLQTAARLCEMRPTVVVFVTAYDEHALAAFDVGAVDYILKPVSYERLEKTLLRLGSSPLAISGPEVTAATHRMGVASPADIESPKVQLEVRQGAKRRFYDARRLQRLMASDKYVVFNDEAGEQQMLDTSLTQLEIQLAPLGFVRVHRQELIQLKAIREIVTQGRSMEAVLHNGERAKISRRLAPKLRRLLGAQSR